MPLSPLGELPAAHVNTWPSLTHGPLSGIPTKLQRACGSHLRSEATGGQRAGAAPAQGAPARRVNYFTHLIYPYMVIPCRAEDALCTPPLPPLPPALYSGRAASAGAAHGGLLNQGDDPWLASPTRTPQWLILPAVMLPAEWLTSKLPPRRCAWRWWTCSWWSAACGRFTSTR